MTSQAAASLAAGLGFIRVDGKATSIFFHAGSNGEVHDLEKDTRVTFSISFSLKGPVALDIAPLLI
jgi:cold shock CspA family protein